MKLLEVELGKGMIILFMVLFSCKEKKLLQEKDKNDKISVTVLSIEKKKELHNISILVDNNSDDKYVMLYNYHGFEEKKAYPKVIEKVEETIIDYNFFFRDHINQAQDSIMNDPSIQNTNESFTLFILPKGKTKVTLKNIPLSNTINKKYLHLYFSKMNKETFNILPKYTREYDIIANEKGFRNYKFSKKVIAF
ncbi:hypothetical protein [Chryseobacterium kwangjuense]|uniref:Lipoprotein n=1 Tax=Chryseobacterium kwangjuense TaxID=267125 RepID=A0A135W9P4_9FLAO|nr:hypothetical protein [Chryseobacterium kwangjuense]KXH81442.1 hypothetical protein AU378_17215 [Chryseobacterium kwangjuense]